MGLKGYRLWVMGQLDSNVQSPTTGIPGRQCSTTLLPLVVAVQVENSEKATFENQEKIFYFGIK
jgi:hypothetical protein